MGKISREELLFTQLVIRTGLLTLEQYQEVLEARGKIMQSTGTFKSVDEIIVEKKYIEQKVVNNIRQKVGLKPATTISTTPASTTTPNERTTFSPDSPWQGDILDNPPAPEGYRLAEKLGEGSMGVVFKGYALQNNQAVAIKFLDPRYNKSVEWVRRFRREAEAVKRLQHPHIVNALTSGEYKGVYYLVMEYVPGESLYRILEREKKLSPERALNILKQIASALQEAHKHGIIHRDIKPENILVAPGDNSKLCDFGLVRNTESDTLSTRVGSFVGTPHYVAPEQARGLVDIDCRTDIYSLGCTFYHMLTGQPPYPHDNPIVVLTSQATKPFPDPILLVPDLPGKISALIRKMTAKDRSLRMNNSDTLLQAIEDVTNPHTMHDHQGSVGDTARLAAHKTQRFINTRRRLPTYPNAAAKKSRDGGTTASKKVRETEVTFAIEATETEESPHPPEKYGKFSWLILLGILLTLAGIVYLSLEIWRTR
jgi:serine/threonine protein kinase